MVEKNGPNEKHTYTQNLAEIKLELRELKTISSYQENHLGNIDSHLDKLNDRTKANEIGLVKAASNVRWVIRIGGVIFGGGGITTLTLWIVGVI